MSSSLSFADGRDGWMDDLWLRGKAARWDGAYGWWDDPRNGDGNSDNGSGKAGSVEVSGMLWRSFVEMNEKRREKCQILHGSPSGFSG